MKKLIIISAFLFIAQNVAGAEYYFSYEARGAFFGFNKFTIAEGPRLPFKEFDPDTYKDFPEFRIWRLKYLGPTGEKHLMLDFDASYSQKSGLGVRFKNRFDIGLFTTQLWNTSATNDPDSFADTIHLDTGNDWYISGTYDTTKSKGLATHKFYFWNVDFETGYTFNISNMMIRLNGGIRYAEYYQDYRETRNNEMFGFDQKGERIFHSLRTIDLDINGIGPRIGVGFNVPITGAEFLHIFTSFNYSWLISKKTIIDQANSILWESQNPNIYSWYDDQGYKVKNKDIRIDIMEIEGGIEYLFKIGEKASMVFKLGYRYDRHFNAFTNCGHSKIVIAENRHNPKNRFFGNCVVHIHGPNFSKNPHSVHDLGSDFISHGPFLRTSISF